MIHDHLSVLFDSIELKWFKQPHKITKESWETYILVFKFGTYDCHCEGLKEHIHLGIHYLLQIQQVLS
jgi:hypothetical protein